MTHGGELLRIYISVTSVFEEMNKIAICSERMELQERGSGRSIKSQLGSNLYFEDQLSTT
jgi:hypothetical protein